MKRFTPIVLILVMMASAMPMLAQQASPDLITLNDATPAVDVVISLPANTTGTIALDIALAAVTLTDGNNTTVFYTSDERVRGLEFNIAPNSGTHTLTIERLPNVTEAQIRVASLPEMTLRGDVQLTDSTQIGFNEEVALQLSADRPGGAVTISVPENSTGALTATFPGASATTQLVDDEGVVLAESSGGHVDGVTFVLDAGDYDFTILGNNLTENVVAGVRAVSADDGGFVLIEAPVQSAVIAETVISETTTVQVDTVPASDCTATVGVSSVSLRSGPGTGYSVLGYGYRGESYPVGGRNPEDNWLVVGTSDGGSAWLAMSTIQTQGACNNLTVFNIPLRDAVPAQIVITSPNSSSTYDDDDDYYEYDDDDDHDDHDDDYYEYDGDDDDHDDHDDD